MADFPAAAGAGALEEIDDILADVIGPAYQLRCDGFGAQKCSG